MEEGVVGRPRKASAGDIWMLLGDPCLAGYRLQVANRRRTRSGPEEPEVDMVVSEGFDRIGGYRVVLAMCKASARKDAWLTWTHTEAEDEEAGRGSLLLVAESDPATWNPSQEKVCIRFTCGWEDNVDAYLERWCEHQRMLARVRQHGWVKAKGYDVYILEDEPKWLEGTAHALTTHTREHSQWQQVAVQRGREYWEKHQRAAWHSVYSVTRAQRGRSWRRGCARCWRGSGRTAASRRTGRPGGWRRVAEPGPDEAKDGVEPGEGSGGDGRGGTVLGLGFLVALVLCAGFMLLPGVAVWGVRETWRMLVGG